MPLIAKIRMEKVLTQQAAACTYLLSIEIGPQQSGDKGLARLMEFKKTVTGINMDLIHHRGQEGLRKALHEMLFLVSALDSGELWDIKHLFAADFPQQEILGQLECQQGMHQVKAKISGAMVTFTVKAVSLYDIKI